VDIRCRGLIGPMGSAVMAQALIFRESSLFGVARERVREMFDWTPQTMLKNGLSPAISLFERPLCRSRHPPFRREPAAQRSA
jgi:hypothetical protein